MYESGDQIDIWVVERALGAGGMASVYRCHNKDAPRICAAIKVLDSMLSRDDRLRKRFINEAVILYDLDHPNIVRVKNIRTNTIPPFLEMEFVSGESLDDRLRRGALPLREALDVMRQSTDALKYLHARGVCHRDIKPANILVRSDGTLKLVDFGLAIEVDRTRITEQGVSFGTVSYAPPEWVSPERLMPRSWDIYALGVVFWECLTGQVAFPVSGQGSSKQQAMQVMVQKQNHPSLDPGPTFNDDIRALIREMTASSPEDRLSDAAALAERVHTLVPVMRPDAPVESPHATSTPAPPIPAQTWGDSVSHVAHPPTIAEPYVPEDAEPAQPSERRSPLVAVGILLGVLLVLAATGIGMTQLGPSTSAVTVYLTGAPAGSQAHVRLDGREPDSLDGFEARFDAVEPGTVTLDWTLGCEPCEPGACAAWCGSGRKLTEIIAGRSEQAVTITLPPVPSHEIVVELSTEQAPAILELGTVTGTWSEGRGAFRVAPGEHALFVGVGDCPAACRDSDCGERCAVHQQTVIVPFDGPLPELSIDIEAPAPEEEPPPAPASAPVLATTARPRPTARATSGPGSQLVTNSAFARWVASNPSWSAAEAVTRGYADEGYLTHFVDDQPADGTGGSPVTNISWYAADAYCHDRGGLRGADAEPLTWPETGAAPSFEWRAGQDGRGAWRGANGDVSDRFRRTSVGPSFGFRCNR